MSSQSCPSVVNVTIGEDVTNIAVDAFQDCVSQTSFTVDANNSVYSSANGVLLDKDRKTLIKCPMGKTASFTIPDSVTNIAVSAFENCVGLTNVTMGAGVIGVGGSAFLSCSNMVSVTIGSNVIAPSFRSPFSSLKAPANGAGQIKQHWRFFPAH